MLAQETGTEPSALVRSIERRAAAGWVGDGVDAEDPVPALAAPAAGTRSVIDIPLPGVLAQGPPLIGRRRELTWLESELVLARSSSLRTVLLSGEAGIGKTTLLGAFARAQHGRGGNTVVYGRCDDGAAVPLQPFASTSVASSSVSPPTCRTASGCRHRSRVTKPPCATTSSNRSPTSCAASRPGARRS